MAVAIASGPSKPLLGGVDARLGLSGTKSFASLATHGTISAREEEGKRVACRLALPARFAEILEPGFCVPVPQRRDTE